jgi:hypothetical protein
VWCPRLHVVIYLLANLHAESHTSKKSNDNRANRNLVFYRPSVELRVRAMFEVENKLAETTSFATWPEVCERVAHTTDFKGNEH